MKIDVSSILKETGGKIDIDGTVMLNDTEFLGEYRFDAPLTVNGSISNNGKSLIMRAEVSGEVNTNCARCMKDITVPVRFDIDENLVREGGGVDAESDVILFHDNTVLIDDIVYDNFIMNVPGKYLCREDCKGLCPTCGKDLNEGDCGCDAEAIDPRWAALADIMKNNKE